MLTDGLQHFVNGRTALLANVAINTLGGVVGLGVALLLGRRVSHSA